MSRNWSFQFVYQLFIVIYLSLRRIVFETLAYLLHFILANWINQFFALAYLVKSLILSLSRELYLCDGLKGCKTVASNRPKFIFSSDKTVKTIVILNALITIVIF